MVQGDGAPSGRCKARTAVAAVILVMVRSFGIGGCFVVMMVVALRVVALLDGHDGFVCRPVNPVSGDRLDAAHQKGKRKASGHEGPEKAATHVKSREHVWVRPVVRCLGAGRLTRKKAIARRSA